MCSSSARILLLSSSSWLSAQSLEIATELIIKLTRFTEKDSQVLLLVDEHVEHLVGDIFDLLAADLMGEPYQNFVLGR